MVLETPGGDSWFVRNLRTMRDLVGQKPAATDPVR